MKITAENLNQKLDEAGNLLLVKVQQDGNPHKYQIPKTDTVTYAPPLVYNTAEEVMSEVNLNPESLVTLIHFHPNRPTQKYIVKFGEVL